MQALELSGEEKNNVFIIKVSGTVDSDTYTIAREKIENWLSSGRIRIVLDLSGVTYMSSAGWGIIVGNSKNAREKGGDIRIAAMQEEVENVFRLVQFDEVIKGFKNVDEAVNSFR